MGRSIELSRVTRELTEGRGVLLEGAAGVGKSRLLQEVAGWLDPGGFTVKHVYATEAMSTIPLGALAEFLPSQAQHDAVGARELNLVLDGLVRRLSGVHNVVLAIDDIQLLDATSADLVLRATRAGYVLVLAARRTPGRAPDSVAELWKRDLVTRIPVPALDRSQTEHLLARALGGQVERRTGNRLWQLTEGNVLTLRELVDGLRQAGEVSQVGGLWRWSGDTRLHIDAFRMIEDRVRGLPDNLRTVVELVALAEPIDYGMLVGLVEKAEDDEKCAVTLAEDQKLIQVDRGRHRWDVRLDHPLFGEVVRGMPHVGRHLGSLADYVERTGMRRRDDELHVAVWRMKSKTASDPHLLVRAGRTAYARFDLSLAGELGKAAMAAGGGFDAIELRASILGFTGKPQQAVELLNSAESALEIDEQRTRWSVARGMIEFGMLSDPTAAERLWRDAEASSGPGAALLRAISVCQLAWRGDFPAAYQRLVEGAGTAGSWTGGYLFAEGHRLLLAAYHGGGELLLDELHDFESRVPDHLPEFPYLRAVATLARWSVTATTGSLLLRGNGSGSTDDFPLFEAQEGLAEAMRLRLAGRFESAHAATLEALALAEKGGRTLLSALLAEQAQCAALLGRYTEAAHLLKEADRRHAQTMTLMYPWIELARAQVAASAEDFGTVESTLGRLVGRLHDDGFHGLEIHALLALLRYGLVRPADVERLRQLESTVDGRLPVLVRRHAEALLVLDQTALRASADSYATLGLRLYAAETAAQAFRLPRPKKATGVGALAGYLADLLSELDHPWVPAPRIPIPKLSNQQWKVAGLAAKGQSDREISKNLYLEKRTTENHLYEVYKKLNIPGRAELAGLIELYELLRARQDEC
ncbi:LuxR C-terminal-related transcriptional regulator [Frankia sp. Cj3]|uniref:LuxR C-terminal-related transcriptional regulator n=1 Tax=Frankia sp. Cj3 TaxID=2880976 RepID=UPI001EF51534|nr:LuxR C-terminal-related transcriptional regulator [Frankia sp. Cj3]